RDDPGPLYPGARLVRVERSLRPQVFPLVVQALFSDYSPACQTVNCSRVTLVGWAAASPPLCYHGPAVRQRSGENQCPAEMCHVNPAAADDTKASATRGIRC